MPFWCSDQIYLKNCDPNLINWHILFHNVDMDQKFWSLTPSWTQLTFCPIQLILGQLVNWLSKNVIQSLKLDMSNVEGPKWSMKVIWGIKSSIILVQSQPLIFCHQCLRRYLELINPSAVLNKRRSCERIFAKLRGKILGYNTMDT